MTPRNAEEKLRDRKRRHAAKPGPMPLGFTDTDLVAVRTLAAHGHTYATIATRAGLSLAQFRKAREKDEKLRDALTQGRAEEKLRVTQALLKTALDPKATRQVEAARLVLKARHGFAENGKGGVDVDVTVNNLQMPGPLNQSTYKKLIKAARADERKPALIEHDDDRTPIRMPVDPIAAVRDKQRTETRDD